MSVALQTAKLGELVEILSGFAFDSEQFGDTGDLPIVRIRDVVPGRSSTFYRGDYDPKYVLQDGDLLIGMDGKFNRARWNGGKALLNQRVCRISSSSHELDDAYLFYFLPAALKVIEAVTPFVTVKHLSVKSIRDIEIPLPPLAEQQRIAEILDRAETLKAKRRTALAQLDTLTQTIFLDLFGDHEFSEPTIGDLLESASLLLHKDGNHGSLYPRADDFGDEGVPFLSAKAVTDDGLIDNNLVERLREKKAVKLRIGWIAKGDVLLAHNASVGKVALYDGRFEKALIGTSLTAFRPNPEKFDSHFLTAALRSSKFQCQLEKNMGQTTRNQVPITAQRKLRIVFPPLDLQNEFARRVAAVDKLKAAHHTSLAEMDALFASLQHRAFRGEL
ncbi:MAG: restriction endonuclease subunit S [Syntrophales bacterium]|nr:restriction endonuclease subunit S [Syntrophales bacterium]